MSTTASLLADTHPDLFAGVWWDGAEGQYVFDTVDVSAATLVLEEGLPAGTSYRLEHVARSFAELRVLSVSNRGPRNGAPSYTRVVSETSSYRHRRFTNTSQA